MADLDPWGPSDPLGEALHYLRMNGVYYCRSELTAPWGFSLPPMPGYLWFHVVASGGFSLDAGAEEPTFVGQGDLSLVPRGEGQVLRSEPGIAAPDILELEVERISDRYDVLRHGEGGVPTTLICGAVRFDHPAGMNLVQVLPRILHIPAADSRMDRIQGTLALMAAEARELRPGGEAVITRLADILVIQAIRSWIETDPGARAGWLGALQDPQIGRAISLVHRDPSRHWTLASLAAEVAMSRSAFAARFSELVGEPAMQYVTRWRMQLAQTALQADGATAAELANRLGYRSEAAFARAFKRVVGAPPGAVKRAPQPALASADGRSLAGGPTTR
jgi:AraC-like DNA-binding protein